MCTKQSPFVNYLRNACEALDIYLVFYGKINIELGLARVYRMNIEKTYFVQQYNLRCNCKKRHFRG